LIELGRLDHGQAITKAAGCLLNPIYDVVMSRTNEDGKLLGGVVFTSYTRESIGLHLAGFDPHWMSKDFIWVVMHYAFVQLKCSSIFAQIRSRNNVAIAFTEKFGFTRVATVSGVYPDGEDVLVYRLSKESGKRWLRLKPKEVTFKGNFH
jgi:RimJ/RimL family protein N-acetyltransferase